MILTDELSLSKLPAEYVDILDNLTLGRAPSVEGHRTQLTLTFKYPTSKAQFCSPLEKDPSLCSLGDGDPLLPD